MKNKNANIGDVLFTCESIHENLLFMDYGTFEDEYEISNNGNTE